MAAVAFPAGFRTTGLPFGVTVLGPAKTDNALLHIADGMHRRMGGSIGGVNAQLSDSAPIPAPKSPPGCTLVAVVGAHLTGQPLNRLLTGRSARLVSTTKTSSCYRFYALAGTVPPKPGLVRDPGYNGPGIEVEVWAIPTHNFGPFVAEIPPPLGIGSIELADGTWVKGFICEPAGISGAIEITNFGGWRNYLAHR
jgi:allophanate hydrolase